MLIWSIVNGILILSYICGLQIENLIIPCILGIQKKSPDIHHGFLLSTKPKLININQIFIMQS